MKLHTCFNFRETDEQYVLYCVLHIKGYRIFRCIFIISCIYNSAKSKQDSSFIDFADFAYWTKVYFFLFWLCE